ncbi:MAG: hypothetical protein ACQERR_03370 [Pseudomonadota bacterium]
MILWLGIILVAVGMIFGFGGMVVGAEEGVVNLIALVPWGFLLLLAGTVGTQLSRPASPGESDRRSPE